MNITGDVGAPSVNFEHLVGRFEGQWVERSLVLKYDYFTPCIIRFPRVSVLARKDSKMLGVNLQ